MPQKIAVITGAAAGIGRATAVEFARQGWRVALLARGIDGLEGARHEIEQAGSEAMVMTIDDITPDDFKRATDVTYLGTVWGTMAALKRMKARNNGVIVQVGSALAYRSIPLQAPYCGAKAAIRGFTDSLRSELIHDKSRVHVTMAMLSAFNTPQFDWGRTCLRFQPQPLGKIFQPEVAARGIYWAATHRRCELWIGFPALEAISVRALFPVSSTASWRFKRSMASILTNRFLPTAKTICISRCRAITAPMAASIIARYRRVGSYG